MQIVSEKKEPLSPIKIEMVDLPQPQLSKNLAHEGKIQFARTVTDNLGKHIILYCLTGEVPNKKSETGEPEADSYLYIYDYIQKDVAYQLNWKIQDNI